MDGLPQGTVTFLFTDVEGSTELLSRIGKDAYATLLEEHHRLVDGAVADENGKVVDVLLSQTTRELVEDETSSRASAPTSRRCARSRTGRRTSPSSRRR